MLLTIFPGKRSSKNLLPNFAGSSPPSSPKTSSTSLWKSMVLHFEKAENGGLDLAFLGRPDFQSRGRKILILKGKSGNPKNAKPNHDGSNPPPPFLALCRRLFWGVAKGSSISWVAKLKGEKYSECKRSNGRSRSYREIKFRKLEKAVAVSGVCSGVLEENSGEVPGKLLEKFSRTAKCYKF